MVRVGAIVLAAGKGRRMGADINKQFLTLQQRPILYYSLSTFESCVQVDYIVLVAAKEEVDYCRAEIKEKYNFSKIVNIVSGGKERQDSVLKGLEAMPSCDVVLIHDGARPFVSHKIIEDGIKYAAQYGAASCGVPAKDTIKLLDKDNFGEATPDRDKLYIVQTPQCFSYEHILKCHRKLKALGEVVTDDTSVVERFGNRVYFYEGSYNNIKITTPEDIPLAENILSKIQSSIDSD